MTDVVADLVTDGVGVTVIVSIFELELTVALVATSTALFEALRDGGMRPVALAENGRQKPKSLASCSEQENPVQHCELDVQTLFKGTQETHTPVMPFPS